MERTWSYTIFTATLLTIALGLAPGIPAHAGPLEDGEAAFQNGHDDVALRLWRPLAEAGNAEAQYGLGHLYDNVFFDKVPQDPSEALKWFRKAAEQGHARAQNTLGGIYRTGRGVLRDYAEALKWYRKAADQGNADAEVSLGRMYFSGEGVPKDHAEALKWFRKAVDQGGTTNDTQWSLTALRLGDMYRDGDGAPRDYVEADKWYLLVAERGETAARKAALRHHEVVAAKMTPAELVEAKKRAQEWKPKRP